MSFPPKTRVNPFTGQIEYLPENPTVDVRAARPDPMAGMFGPPGLHGALYRPQPQNLPVTGTVQRLSRGQLLVSSLVIYAYTSNTVSVSVLGSGTTDGVIVILDPGRSWTQWTDSVVEVFNLNDLAVVVTGGVGTANIAVTYWARNNL